MPDVDQDATAAHLDRRTVIRGAGVVGVAALGATALTGCGGDSGTSTSTAGSSSSAATSTQAGGSGGGAGIPKADIPVGGGTIFAATKTVVTQPKAGEFKAFTAICTHQGCPVAQRANGTIDCTCHGSQYDISTGAVTRGPATRPLLRRRSPSRATRSSSPEPGAAPAPSPSAATPRVRDVADPSTYRPRPGEIPVDPGVYRFRDAHGRVIYVGKAKSLRPRLSSYFQDISALHPRTRTMVTTGGQRRVDRRRNEVEALQLEYSWIKEFDPRFNVKYRDDKSYPYLAVTMGEEFPRAQVMRGAKRKGTRYFGPYAHAWAIRETLDLLLRVFPMRTCSAGVFKRAAPGRPAVPARLHRQVLGAVRRPGRRRRAPGHRRGLLRLHGRQHRPVRQAARARDARGRRRAGLRAGGPAARRHRRARPGAGEAAVVLGDATDADVFALAEDELEAAVQVFHVRGGRVRGQRGWVVEKASEDTAPSWSSTCCSRSTAASPRDAVPREVLVPALPADADASRSGSVGLRGARRRPAGARSAATSGR